MLRKKIKFSIPPVVSEKLLKYGMKLDESFLTTILNHFVTENSAISFLLVAIDLLQKGYLEKQILNLLDNRVESSILKAINSVNEHHDQLIDYFFTYMEIIQLAKVYYAEGIENVFAYLANQHRVFEENQIDSNVLSEVITERFCNTRIISLLNLIINNIDIINEHYKDVNTAIIEAFRIGYKSFKPKINGWVIQKSQNEAEPSEIVKTPVTTKQQTVSEQIESAIKKRYQSHLGLEECFNIVNSLLRMGYTEVGMLQLVKIRTTFEKFIKSLDYIFSNHDKLIKFFTPDQIVTIFSVNPPENTFAVFNHLIESYDHFLKIGITSDHLFTLLQSTKLSVILLDFILTKINAIRPCFNSMDELIQNAKQLGYKDLKKFITRPTATPPLPSTSILFFNKLQEKVAHKECVDSSRVQVNIKGKSNIYLNPMLFGNEVNHEKEEHKEKVESASKGNTKG